MGFGKIFSSTASLFRGAVKDIHTQFKPYMDYRNKNNLYYASTASEGILKEHVDLFLDPKTRSKFVEFKRTVPGSAGELAAGVSSVIEGINGALYNEANNIADGRVSFEVGIKRMELALTPLSYEENVKRGNTPELKLGPRKKYTERGGITSEERAAERRRYEQMLRKHFKDNNPDMYNLMNLAGKHTDLKATSPERADFVLAAEKNIEQEIQKNLIRTGGDKYYTTDKFKEWFDSDAGKEFLGISGRKNKYGRFTANDSLAKHFLKDKYDKGMNDLINAGKNGNFANNTDELGNMTFTPHQKKKRGFNFFGALSKTGGNIFELTKDMTEFAVKSAVDVATHELKMMVKAVEAVDDIAEGKNIIDTATEFAKEATGVNHLEEGMEQLENGDIVGATMDFSSFANNVSNPGASEIAQNFDATMDKNETLSGLKEDINEGLGGGELPPEEDIDVGDIKMDPIEKTAMAELRALLGIYDGAADSEVIDALVGSEARKLADNEDIASVLRQQRQVAEQGYDVGEREALSSKARRDLAGLARRQGMAAGAAAGGMRGASVAAQSRALSEAAMQKAADVTTEMDKASIARKDEARRDLSKSAREIGKFDIEQEEKRKRRKGATTVGVASLLQGEEMGKYQMQLANEEKI